jgi:hypothetical protein
MPRFYFNLADDVFVADEEGRELPHLEAARKEAAKYARDMSAATILEQGKINLHHRIDVVDEAGETVLKVEFADVVKIETSRLPDCKRP